MICELCGNQIIHGSGPVCLACQHTVRDSGKAMEAHARGLAAALDATYEALCRRRAIDEEMEAAEVCRMAEIALASRMSANIHVRPRPKWTHESEAAPECLVCKDTGHIAGRRCRHCYEPDERE